MGGTHTKPFSQRFSEAIQEGQRKRDIENRNNKVYGKKIQKVEEFDPILTDTQQAEDNRIQNEEGGKALCRGEECEPHILPVVNPNE